MPPLEPFKGTEEPQAPEWENLLFEAQTMEEVAVALALRDTEEGKAPRPDDGKTGP